MIITLASAPDRRCATRAPPRLTTVTMLRSACASYADPACDEARLHDAGGARVPRIPRVTRRDYTDDHYARLRAGSTLRDESAAAVDDGNDAAALPSLRVARHGNTACGPGFVPGPSRTRRAESAHRR